MFVLHRHGPPAAVGVLQRDAIWVRPKFHNVAVSTEPQPVADDFHPPRDEQIAPPLALRGVMAAGMFQPPLRSAKVLRPLLFEVDERPLTAAEAKMLDAGHQQVIVRGGHQDILSQLTPSGRVSDTVTV